MSYTNGLDKPTDYFNTKLYSGNGSATQAITGVGYQPDWVWIKSRNNASENHMLSDVVRGSTKRLRSDTNNAEDDLGLNGLQSFDTDGFTVGDGDAINASGQTYASWNWLAGGTASSNTDGSITSSVSANTTSGFSIVSYTGTGAVGTIGHGLGAEPKMIIIKSRSDPPADHWWVYHNSLGNGQSIYLNLTSASGSTNDWNSTSPTSSVFTINGAQTGIGYNGGTFIAYCFAEKKGFSKFGSYTGNGNADGTFVYTGFSPSFVMHKRTDTTNNWIMQDNKRVGYNADNRILKANLSDAEQGVHEMDFVSNGFKIRTTGAGSNASGGSYIYMAFASSPFVTSTSIPTTAR